MKPEMTGARATAEQSQSARASSSIPTCAAVVEMAGLLLAQTTAETQAPIARLSEALSCLARRLLEAGVPLGGAEDPRLDPLRADFAAIGRDLGVCIESLQFHDRLVQQLTRVQGILTNLANNRRLASLPAVSGDPGSIELF